MKPKKLSKTKLQKKADSLWADLIRSRDPICRLCKKRPSKNAHHIMSRRHKSTRYNLQNGLGLCYRCHQPEGHADPCHLTELIIMEIGEDLYMELLRESRVVVKYDMDWLESEIERLSHE